MSAYWNTLVSGAFDRADRHRSQNRATLRAAAVEMARSGLTARDIASSLGLIESAVRKLLEAA